MANFTEAQSVQQSLKFTQKSEYNAVGICKTGLIIVLVSVTTKQESNHSNE